MLLHVAEDIERDLTAGCLHDARTRERQHHARSSRGATVRDDLGRPRRSGDVRRAPASGND